jgi:hypothetical protein
VQKLDALSPEAEMPTMPKAALAEISVPRTPDAMGDSETFAVSPSARRAAKKAPKKAAKNAAKQAARLELEPVTPRATPKASGKLNRWADLFKT